MTVHDMTSGHPASSEESENVPSTTSTPTSEKSSCFFEWSLQPKHRLKGSLDKYQCDLCHEEIVGEAAELKLHQIGLHINPFYLSASDRILAQISSYAVQTEKTEGPWIPDWDTFKVH